MIHRMKLQPEPFEKIRFGAKTVELRLNDEKRKKLALNDIIEFRCTADGRCLRARVTALHRYDSFEELYASLPLEKCGYSPEEVPAASARDMERYYSREEQLRWGVLGIGLKVVQYRPQPSLVKTSRHLSLLLRHKPEAAGLTLDAHGWADVEELIRCVNKSRYLDMDMLERIVAEDSKQRYAFSHDKKKIRANQGHSVRVDVQPEQLAPPEYLWHGTAEKYVESILVSGLKPGGRIHVHLSSEYDTAVTVGSRHGKSFVFRVASGQMHADGYLFYRSANGVWLTDHVPSKYLETHGSP